MNVELERQVLGTALLSNYWAHWLNRLPKIAFGDPVHALIWQAISDIVDKDQIANPRTVQMWLRRRQYSQNAAPVLIQIAIAGIADHHRQGEIMRQWKAQHGIAA
jgi:replicative DNA helicase